MMALRLIIVATIITSTSPFTIHGVVPRSSRTRITGRVPQVLADQSANTPRLSTFRPHESQDPPSLAEAPLLTMEEITDCAAAYNISLRLSTLGPLYRVVARQIEKDEPLGYTSGFVAPIFGFVHLDTMQVRRSYWKKLDRASRFPYGLGVLLGAVAMRHAYDCGCKKAELLAINDDPRSHALLVGFYSMAGFEVVREVTQDIGSIPDLLRWGGVGTRMDIGVQDYLRRWATMIRSRGMEVGPSRVVSSLRRGPGKAEAT